MLQLLHIENIAVIERADIELEDGLTVLSGETGAGKSIVIDSIGALLSRRVSRDLVRAGAQKGFVSAVFADLSDGLAALLEELALTGDEPDTLHIQRQITADGKSNLPDQYEAGFGFCAAAACALSDRYTRSERRPKAAR